jgi:predicted Zn-dependent protease
MVNRWQARFESPEGIWETPLPRLQIDIGESDEIVLTDSDQPDGSIITFDRRILNDRCLLQQSQTRDQIKAFAVQGDSRRRLKVTAWVIGTFVLLSIVGTVLTRLMARSLAEHVPVKWEVELGSNILAQIQQEKTFTPNAKLTAALYNASAPIVAVISNSPVQFKFYVMEENLPNAFALPGGHVVVTTGLLYLVDTPEELAAVIAHELAHHTQRHVYRKIISSLGPYVIFTMFVGNGPLRALSENSEMIASQSFSQGYELEADSVGWDYMVAANVNPRGMIGILTKLKAEQDRMKHIEGFEAFSSHPPTQKRIDRLQKRWDRLKDKSHFISFSEP